MRAGLTAADGRRRCWVRPCVCVCACACASVRARARRQRAPLGSALRSVFRITSPLIVHCVCVRTCVCVCVRVCGRVCVRRQMALLGSAFYFVFHTTSPLIVHWASDGKETELSWELDFAYFYRRVCEGVCVRESE